ncbi:MAG: DUF3617 family protein [Sphingomicrobium sp.]
MKRIASLGGWAVGGAAVVLALGAAAHPAALAATSGGLWELAGVPGAAKPARQCVVDTAALAQYEHRAQSCTRVVISDVGSTTVIHYTCTGGGFGQSKITVITPRSMRIETQGISDNFPFNYTLQARRIGDCAAH